MTAETWAAIHTYGWVFVAGFLTGVIAMMTSQWLNRRMAAGEGPAPK